MYVTKTSRLVMFVKLTAAYSVYQTEPSLYEIWTICRVTER
jgi:hypothetical protein